MLSKHTTGKNSYSPYSVELRRMAKKHGSHEHALDSLSYKPKVWLKVGGNPGSNSAFCFCPCNSTQGATGKQVESSPMISTRTPPAS